MSALRAHFSRGRGKCGLAKDTRSSHEEISSPGIGHPDVLRLLPATLDPGRVALVGLHSWTEDDFPNIARWGIRSFRPDELHRSSQPLLDWRKRVGMLACGHPFRC